MVLSQIGLNGHLAGRSREPARSRTTNGDPSTADSGRAPTSSPSVSRSRGANRPAILCRTSTPPSPFNDPGRQPDRPGCHHLPVLRRPILLSLWLAGPDREPFGRDDRHRECGVIFARPRDADGRQHTVRTTPPSGAGPPIYNPRAGGGGKPDDQRQLLSPSGNFRPASAAGIYNTAR